MLRRSPLKAKRETPRRNEGRVQHGRIKPQGYTALEEFHVARLRTLKCLLAHCSNKAIAHHIMKVPLGYTKRKRRDHRFAVHVCDNHHNLQKDSIHLLGSEEKFNKYYGVDLFQIALAEWNISVELFEKAKS